MDGRYPEGCVQESEGTVSLLESRREPRMQGHQATDRVSPFYSKGDRGLAQKTSGGKEK